MNNVYYREKALEAIARKVLMDYPRIFNTRHLRQFPSSRSLRKTTI